MADRDRVAQLLFHYLAMIVLIFFSVNTAGRIAGELDFLVEMLIAFTVAALYILFIRHLDVIPDSW